MSKYYSTRSGMPNTCSIKSLKQAFIGVGVRMSSDKNTVPFVNVPMKGMIIEKYNDQGFRISHPALPKSVWVNFDQLPLTRLQINNGVIYDEITFVENIVNHQMQLIRTLDTEYIDMIYKEKTLNEKKIIPISEAIPGQIYIGAQCEEGTEMIYLGTFFIKEMRSQTNYRYHWAREEHLKHYFSKLSPLRAFFAIPEKRINKKEEIEFERNFFGSSEVRWKMHYEKREQIDKEMLKAKEKFLAEQKIPRFKILEFAVTSKRIKDVIVTFKENSLFTDKKENMQNILSFMADEDVKSPTYIISNNRELDVFFISEDKNIINEEGKIFAKEKKNVIIEPQFWENK